MPIPTSRAVWSATCTGLADTGAALCRSGVDKLAFTGSVPTGRRVMATCAENLTPVVLELGGKDADGRRRGRRSRRSRAAVVWGAFFNAGQACVGVERVYVVRAGPGRLPGSREAIRRAGHRRVAGRRKLRTDDHARTGRHRAPPYRRGARRRCAQRSSAAQSPCAHPSSTQSCSSTCRRTTRP